MRCAIHLSLWPRLIHSMMLLLCSGWSHWFPLLSLKMLNWSLSGDICIGCSFCSELCSPYHSLAPLHSSELHLFCVLSIKFQCWGLWGRLLPYIQQANLQTSSWGPTVQPNSNTIYLDTVRFHRLRAQSYCPPKLQMPVASPGYYLYFWQTGCKSEFPTTPSSGSINLPEWLIKLRNISCIRLLVYYKGLNSGTAR